MVATATTSTFSTAPGALNGTEPVNASAQFTAPARSVEAHFRLGLSEIKLHICVMPMGNSVDETDLVVSMAANSD
jgi:hypothetical protein